MICRCRLPSEVRDYEHTYITNVRTYILRIFGFIIACLRTYLRTYINIVTIMMCKWYYAAV